MEGEDMRKELKWFAEIQEAILKENDDKEHWCNCSNTNLFKKLMDEVAELYIAIEEDDMIIEECCDIANFAMMIADNNEKPTNKNSP
jgi:hypothetical protein